MISKKKWGKFLQNSVLPVLSTFYLGLDTIFFSFTFLSVLFPFTAVPYFCISLRSQQNRTHSRPLVSLPERSRAAWWHHHNSFVAHE